MIFVSPVSVGLAAFLLAPLLAGAQTPSPETVFSGSVEVTAAEVEVYVTDRDGKPVPDLTREDFRVTEDGKSAEVTGVSPGTSQHLNLAVFFDQTTMDTASRNTALAGLRRFFEAGLRPGDRVLFASWDGSLEVRPEATADPKVLGAALDRLGASVPSGLRSAQERNAVQREIAEANFLDEGRGRSMAIAQATAALDNLRIYARQRADETQATFGALQQTLVLLAGLPERKALLYVGGGPPLRPGADLFTTWEGRFGTLSSSLGFSPLEVSRYDAGPQVQGVVDRANGAGISLFALALPMGGAGTRSDAEDSGRALRTLAAGTGGRVVTDVANPASFLELMGRDLSSSYLVAYSLPTVRKPGGHRIEVTVRGGALLARHREARRDGDPGDPLLRQALAALWAGGTGGEANPLRAELTFDDEGKDDLGRLQVSATVAFPLATLLVQPQENFHAGHLTVAVAARDSKGKISGVPRAEVPVEIPNDHLLSAPGQTAGYRFTLHLNIGEKNGESVVAVALRDDISGIQGVVRATVGSPHQDVGAEPAPPRAEATPAPTAGNGTGNGPSGIRAIPASGLGVESAALLMSGQEGGEIPLGALALPIPGPPGPSQEPADRTRLLVRVRVDGKALLAGQTGNVLRLEGDLYALGAGGGVQGSALVRVEIDLPSQRAVIERDGVDLLAGIDLRPGSYSLRMLVRNLDTGKLAVRNLPLTVPDPATLKDAPLPSPPPAADPRPTARMADLGPLDPPPFPDDAPPPPTSVAAAPAMPPPAPVPETAEGRRLRGLARTAYRQALGLLAVGRETEALAAAAAFEDSLLLRAKQPVTVERLVEIESEAVRELAGANPDSLVPLLRLHQRLYQEATTQRRLQGSTVARDVLLQGVDLLRKAGPGQAEVARRFLSAFGVQILRSGVRRQGEQTLRLALADDPGDEVALLELADDAERRGDHAAAIPSLEALLKAHGENREARLRLAIDLGRTGRAADAEQRLTALVKDETGGWRLSLAYQELTRLRLVANHPEAAELTLREGLGRLPGDEKLTLLLADLLERTGQASAARQTLTGFHPEGKEGSGAARRRYSTPPEEPFATALATLAQDAAARLPALAKALEKTAP
ncbi:MAG: hypothetical protein QOF89_2030 [Acidobacteriota bacterium]|jgi:VWFA-related protein|nr:hypothetical protein [Acidobacteriota bacterium]